MKIKRILERHGVYSDELLMDLIQFVRKNDDNLNDYLDREEEYLGIDESENEEISVIGEERAYQLIGTGSKAIIEILKDGEFDVEKVFSHIKAQSYIMADGVDDGYIGNMEKHIILCEFQEGTQFSDYWELTKELSEIIADENGVYDGYVKILVEDGLVDRVIRVTTSWKYNFEAGKDVLNSDSMIYKPAYNYYNYK
jgi:hypothetical protein